MTDEGEVAGRLEDIADAYREHYLTAPSLDHDELVTMTQDLILELGRLKSEKTVLEARVEELEDNEQQRRLGEFTEGDGQ